MKKVVNHLLGSVQEASLRRYASLGLGTAVLAGAVTTMDASVAYTNYNGLVLNDTVTTDTAATTYGFDINGDGSQDFRFQTRNEGTSSTGNYAVIVAGVAGTALKPIDVVGVTNAAGNFGYPSRLGAGVAVNPAKAFITLALTASSYYLLAGTFAFGNGYTLSKWKSAGANSGFLGFRFSAADGVHYGFAELSIGAQGAGALSRAITLNSIAYETTPGAAITTVAAVPEPSSIALVALGGAGLAAYRRRRNAANAANSAATEAAAA